MTWCWIQVLAEEQMWLHTKLELLQCITNVVTTVLHKPLTCRPPGYNLLISMIRDGAQAGVRSLRHVQGSMDEHS